jgi:uncharacterized protein YbjT (DUF2867 family)
MYVITGASGNSGKVVAEKLLAAGKRVTVIGRSAANLSSLVAKGATAATSDLADTKFLTETFKGATAVYAMIPPNFTAPDFRAYQETIATSLTEAIKASGVKHVAVLSSVGAHLSENSGVVFGLHKFENQLATIPSLNVLNIRAGFFMQNFYGSIGLIKSMNINGGFPIQGDVKVGMVHTTDIGNYAAKRLAALDFTGQSHIDLSAEHLTMNEASTILGEAIGNPSLKWVQFSYGDAKNGMMQMGMPEKLADLYVEFCKGVNEGQVYADAKPTPPADAPTTLRQFAKEFAGAFNTQAQPA